MSMENSCEVSAESRALFGFCIRFVVIIVILVYY